MRHLFILVAVAALMSDSSAHAQTIQRPDRDLVNQAKSIVADSIFARIEAGLADELAEWVVDQIHTDASGGNRTQKLSQFQSQFRMIVQRGPTTAFGEMDGYDLIQESSLPGTNRYFRLTYITYHSQVPLVWEFHFYVRPDRRLSVTYFKFDGQNPFSYMTTPDMLIENFYSLF